MPLVTMPDGTNVSFPDEMPKEQIRALIVKKFPEAVPQTPMAPESPQISLEGKSLMDLSPEERAQIREGMGQQAGSFFGGQADARSFGLGDELAAGIGAIPALLSDKMTYNEAYTKNLDRVRGGQERLKERNPGAFLSGQIYGGLRGAGQFAGTKPAQAVANSLRTGEVLGRNLGLLGRAGKVGLAGAVPSGLYGFASGRGVDDRVARAEREGATGAAVGAAIPVAGAALSKIADTVVPKIDDAIKPLVKRAQEFGIPLRLDQIAPSRARNTVQKVSQEIPLSGVDAFEANQRSLWNKAVANRALGAPDLTPEGVNTFLDRMDDAFRAPLKGKTIDIPQGSAFTRKLDNITTEIPKNVANDVAAVVKANIDDVLGNITDGKISGEKLASVRSTLLNRLKSADSRAKPYIGDLIEAIDDTVQGQLGKDAAQGLSVARRQWRNYRTIEPLLEKATEGEINPTELLNRVASSKYIKASRASTGKDDLIDLARIGKQFLPKKGGSDTFQKAALGTGASGIGYLALTNPPLAAAVAGKAAAGVGANRAYQSLYNQSPALVRLAAEKPSQQRIGYESLLRLIEQ